MNLINIFPIMFAKAKVHMYSGDDGFSFDDVLAYILLCTIFSVIVWVINKAKKVELEWKKRRNEKTLTKQVMDTVNKTKEATSSWRGQMFCPNCGTALSEEHKFCTECGTKLPELRGVDTPSTKKQPIFDARSHTHRSSKIYRVPLPNEGKVSVASLSIRGEQNKTEVSTPPISSFSFRINKKVDKNKLVKYRKVNAYIAKMNERIASWDWGSEP